MHVLDSKFFKKTLILSVLVMTSSSFAIERDDLLTRKSEIRKREDENLRHLNLKEDQDNAPLEQAEKKREMEQQKKSDNQMEGTVLGLFLIGVLLYIAK